MAGLKQNSKKKKYILHSAIVDEKGDLLPQPHTFFYAADLEDARLKAKHFQELLYGVFILHFQKETGDTTYNIQAIWDGDMLISFLFRGSDKKHERVVGGALILQAETETETEPNWLEQLQEMKV